MPEVSRWDLVPYTRGRVLCFLAEKAFPHWILFQDATLDLIADGAVDSVVAESAKPEYLRVLREGGFMVLANKVLEHRGGELVPVAQTVIPPKSAAVVRYGAFGDMIQTASVVAGLKKQGYHVTLYCQTGGHEVIANDPHVDRFYLQDRNQVPPAELPSFWAHEREKYAKWVNLSESVEGSLLAYPGRAPHEWPQALRHKLMNRNYLEFMHDIAELPQRDYAPLFYSTDAEKAWAREEKARIGGRVILWSLAGSSVHKCWPHIDAVIARIMLKLPDVSVVLVGDDLCQLLEAPWENEPRVVCRSGKWSIRESMSFAEVADLVIGGETGLLNAAGFMETPKIVTLSHSTHENLTKHWRNTTALVPKTSCHPCHRMHFSFDFCPRDEKTGVAQCQADIGPDEVWAAVQWWMGAGALRRAA